MAGDLLKVADLEKAKLHDTFHSEVISGKEGGLSTGADIDYATNAATGQVQRTMPALLRDLFAIEDAPADGKTYVRVNNAWVEFIL